MRYPLFTVLLLLSAQAYSATIQIEFSGSFVSSCDSGASLCDSDALGSLRSTAFNGVITLPDIATPFRDSNGSAKYLLDSQMASFSFNSENDAFDLTTQEPVSVLVAYSGFSIDFIDISVTSGGYIYSLDFRGNPLYPEWLTDGAFPTLDTLTSPLMVASPGLYISTSGYEISLGTDNYSPSDGYSTTLNPLVISSVPIPAAVWLFGSALGGLGWMRRKRVA